MSQYPRMSSLLAEREARTWASWILALILERSSAYPTGRRSSSETGCFRVRALGLLGRIGTLLLAPRCLLESIADLLEVLADCLLQSSRLRELLLELCGGLPELGLKAQVRGGVIGGGRGLLRF